MPTFIENLARKTSLVFDAELQLDVHTLCSELALWMFDEDAQPASTSLVGIFSSSAFESLVQRSLGVDLGRHLRLLVELTSALYCNSGQVLYAGRQSTELWSMQAFVGTKVLQSLDVIISNVFFKEVSLEKIKALFVALLATIIAVGYFRIWNRGMTVSIPR